MGMSCTTEHFRSGVWSRMADDRSGPRGAIAAAFLANVGIAVIKFVGFLVTGAVSLLAECVHSVADTADQSLLFWGARVGRRESSSTHPFGHGRERYVWAFVVAVVLFTGGGLFALVQAEEKLRHPHELGSVTWAIGILVAAMMFEGLSLRKAVKRARPAKGNSSWLGFIRRSKEAELPVVLLEDGGAVVGLSFALLGVTLSEVFGEPRFDALGSLGIGVLLVVVAWTLASEMKSLLVGESASHKDIAAARHALERDDRIRRIIELRTEQLGPDEVLIGAKLEVVEGLAGADMACTLRDVERAIRRDVPSARIMYLQPVPRDEPDARPPGEGDGHTAEST